MNNRIQIKTDKTTYIGSLRADGTAAFRGICYGITPRWQRGVMAQLPETVDASGDSIEPVQPRGNIDEQREDAVFLNIYLDPRYEGSRAVLVWTPVGGGIFSNGLGVVPEKFLTEDPDIIDVVPNARVGILSSLDLRDFDDAGEYGDIYKYSRNLTKTDYILALQWIREHIADFGGDPERVTIGGHSYGSVVTTSMLLIPEAEPYFDRAIARSSTALDDTMLMSAQEAAYFARKFREYSGVTMIRDALQMSVQELLDVQQRLLQIQPLTPDGDFPGIRAASFSTVVDDVVVKEDYLTPLLKNGRSKKLIIGTTGGDSDMRSIGRAPDEVFGQFFEKYPDKAQRVSPSMAQGAYYAGHGGDEVITAMDFYCDMTFRAQAAACAAAFDGNAYMYYYDFYLQNPEGFRAKHGSAENAAWGRPADTPDYMARVLRDSFAAFIRSGDPNTGNPSFEASQGPQALGSPYREPLEWRPYTPESPWTLEFTNSGCGLREGIRHSDLELACCTVREYEEIMRRTGRK